MKRKKSLSILILIILMVFNSVCADVANKTNPGRPDLQNVAPTVNFSASLRKDIDLIIVTDYSGADMTNISSQINNLKIALSGKYNVNPHFVGVDAATKAPKTVAIGQQTSDVKKYNYQRSFRINYNRTGRESGSGYRIDYNDSPHLETLGYETATIYEGETLPAFQFGNNYTWRLVQAHVAEQLSTAAYIYDLYEVFDPNNEAASKKKHHIRKQFTDISGYHYNVTYSITSTSLDNRWSLTGIGKETKTTSYQAVNMSDLNNIDIKADSEKYVIFLSKGGKAESYREWGKYFSFGSMKNSNIGSFVSNNNPNIYTIMPSNALDLKLDQTIDRLDRVPGQELSISELFTKTSGEIQHYGVDKLATAIEHIKAKYSDHDSNKVDLKIATDYTGAKLTSLNTELTSLKSNLAGYGINLNYELFSNKTINSTKVLKNKKIDVFYGHRLVLREDGTLYYYKNAIDGDPNSMASAIDPQLIFEQYPYAATKITRQPSSYDDEGNPRRYHTLGYSFSGVPIPPIMISDNVTDMAFVDGRIIFYVKSGTLYQIMNKSSYPTDNYIHAAVTNGTNISKIITSGKTLYAIKNDGSLWVISGDHTMYAHGRYDAWENWPQEIRDGLLSSTLYRVGNTSLLNVKFKDVAISYNFALGLTTTGEVYGWGMNTYGQLGNGNSGSISGNTIEPVEYRYPVKANISDIVSIGVYQLGTYYVNSNGVAYFSGLAGYTFEYYDPAIPTPLPTTNPQPVPYYFSKGNMKKHRYLSYDYSSSSFYYQVSNYSDNPILLYSDGIQEISIGVNPIKSKYSSYNWYFNMSGGLNLNINTFKDNVVSRYISESALWSGYSAAEIQKRVTDYNTSYNTLFNPLNKDYSKFIANGQVDPLLYAVLDEQSNLKDNTVMYSTETYNNDNAIRTNTNKLLSLYNISNSSDIFNNLNAPITINYMSLDLTGIQTSTLQAQSDRFFLYASDTYGTTEENLVSYLSLMEVPSSFMSYLSDNNIKASVVTPMQNIADANVVKLLNDKTGIYTNITDFINSIKRMYNPTSSAPANYILVNEDEVDYKNAYADYESDPKAREQFKYEHDPSVFENNTGIIANADQWITTPITKFAKKGKYIIHYRAEDTASAGIEFANYRKWSNESIYTLYVHERPIALTNISITANGSYYRITATDGGSYDNDHTSRADKGIIAHEWRWKESTETSWRNEQMNISDGAANKVYLVEHRVRDIEGAWSNWTSNTIDNTKPPVAQFNVINKTITPIEKLKIKDTSYAYFSTLTRWQWIVVNLSNNQIISNWQFTNSNNGTGVMVGYDVNVKTDYGDVGPGTYRIYLRVKANNGLWSDGGTEALTGYSLSNCFSQDILVKEAYMLEKFRIVMIRDIQLEQYYKNPSYSLGRPFYVDKPMYVSSMAVDASNFMGNITGLTKGYRFEFEIDSNNFNEDADSIVITPKFYTCDLFTRDAEERAVFWEDSDHMIYRAGQGGHSSWSVITLTKTDRAAISPEKATWRGEYLIPATAWAVPLNTSAAEAKAKNLKRDIIVHFGIKGYKDRILKFDYNSEQWGLERTTAKYPYQVGDVIKYSWNKSLLDDIQIKDNR